MSSHYELLIDSYAFFRSFGVAPLELSPKLDVWPGQTGSFIRRRLEADGIYQKADRYEALSGIFGLIPEWTQDRAISRHTFNARCEDAATKPSFKNSWQKAQHCIIAASAIYEPTVRGFRTKGTRVVLRDGEPMGIAGLWSSCQLPTGTIHSFTMLTVNANDHLLMKNFRNPSDEKRMVVILPKEHYRDWLEATTQDSVAFMQPFPAQFLQISERDLERSHTV
jgi:putative SOS response-associated peptidase YedK